MATIRATVTGKGFYVNGEFVAPGNVVEVEAEALTGMADRLVPVVDEPKAEVEAEPPKVEVEAEAKPVAKKGR